MLKTKQSRLIFITTLIATFLAMHFTDALESGGIDFSDLPRTFAQHPHTILLYLAFLFIPAFVAAALIPWAVKWVKSGS